MPVDVPAIGISFKHLLDEHREVVFQGYVPAGCSDEQFNEMLDKLTKASDRQKARVALPTHRGVLELQKGKLVEKTKELYEAHAERDAAKASWTQEAQASQRRNWRPSPAQLQDDIKRQGRITGLEKEIKDLQLQIDGYENLVAQYEAKLSPGA
jgi:hypothetical protein